MYWSKCKMKWGILSEVEDGSGPNTGRSGVGSGLIRFGAGLRTSLNDRMRLSVRAVAAT